MTLRDFIEQLQQLPSTAMDATVEVEYTEGGDLGIGPELSSDLIVHVEYEGGMVRIVTEAADGFCYED